MGAVGPRPIAFASTIDANGVSNLAPFSFFNAFSANPPILVFSPARSGRTNTSKDTYNNVKELPEVVINVVNYELVHQMSLASSPYPSNIDEWRSAIDTLSGSTEIIRKLSSQAKTDFENKHTWIKRSYSLDLGKYF